jgi:hypothetical protein
MSNGEREQTEGGREGGMWHKIMYPGDILLLFLLLFSSFCFYCPLSCNSLNASPFDKYRGGKDGLQ